MWCGVVWCGVVWRGVVRCGVGWGGMTTHHIPHRTTPHRTTVVDSRCEHERETCENASVNMLLLLATAPLLLMGAAGSQSICISSPVSPGGLRVRSLVRVSEGRGTLLFCVGGELLGSVALSFSLALRRSSHGDFPVWVR